MMQLKKNSHKKIIAVALVALMMTSGAGAGLSLADTVEQTETINETIHNNTAEENISNENISIDEAGQNNTDNSQNVPNKVNSVNGEIIENKPEGNIGEENTLEAEDLNNAAKTSAKSFEGFANEGGKWYFYSNGQRKKGWVDYNGVRYYILNTYQLPQNMWRMIKGHKYYFNKDGVMIRNQKMSIDGKIYQFNKEGHLIPNDSTTPVGIIPEEEKALFEQGEKNLIEAQNNKKFGVINEGGTWYKYEDGKRTRGWYKEGNKTYYFLNTLNRAENMWRKINGKLYYFGEGGVMYQDTIRYIGTRTYKFNADGSLNEGAATTIALQDIPVRVSADNTSKIVGKIIKGYGVEVLDKSGNYTKIRNGNEQITGWVPTSSIKRLRQEKINAVISVAKSKLGSPYVWGATGPSTFDCSGLMLYSFKQGAGITLPRVSKNQATAGRYVSRADLQPGDLIFWGRPVHHVALYIGNGKYIHAPQPGDYVRIANLGGYTTARRIIE